MWIPVLATDEATVVATPMKVDLALVELVIDAARSEQTRRALATLSCDPAILTNAIRIAEVAANFGGMTCSAVEELRAALDLVQ